MNETSLTAATAIYTCRSSVQVKYRRIPHAAFEEFSLRLRNLERALGDDASNEYWRPIMRNLKRYRFETSAAPLGFGNPFVMPEELLQHLHDHLAQCPMLYPQFVTSSRSLLESLDRLVEEDDNPLLNDTVRVAESVNRDTGQKLTVLLKESRLMPAFESVLGSENLSGLIEFVGEGQLRGSRCYAAVACIGPSRWFGDHVFSAPRAPRIDVIVFDWIRDERRDTPVFIGSVKPERGADSDWQEIAAENRQAADEIKGHVAGEVRERIEVEELLPSLDLSQISSRLARQSSIFVGGHEEVEGLLFQLEGGSGVFLDASEGSSWMVINLEEEEAARVKRVSVAAIEPGMYMLLREGGGGDYIVPVADRILGSAAANARGLQRAWKSKLREAVNRRGLYAVSRELESLGAIRANESNIRNWMSERNIRTEDERDFAAIMRLVGFGGEKDKCWETAALIDSAHRRAGSHIRKLLLRQVLTADLSELKQRGRMKFELSVSGGGQMIALRVVARAPRTDLIPAGHVGHPVALEEDTWRA